MGSTIHVVEYAVFKDMKTVLLADAGGACGLCIFSAPGRAIA
jgi:hypothetical protein